MRRVLRIIGVGIAFICMICVAGCTKKYEESDVKKYIRDDMQISSFKIVSGPEDVEGEDGYTDQMWTVTTDVFELDEDLTFHVYNDYYYGMEWTVNRLTDDLRYQKQSILLEEFVLPDGFSAEEIKDDSGRTTSFYFVCPIDGREDFKKGFDLLDAYQAHVKEFPTINDMKMSVGFRLKDPDPLTEKRLMNWDYNVSFDIQTTKDDLEDAISHESDEYLMDCIEDGLIDRMEEYSAKERSAVIQLQENNTEIRRIGESSAAYPGYAYNFYYYIPYGTLFKILEQEGYEPQGDWKSFSFVGDDGNEHSYAYAEEYKDGAAVEEINSVTHLNLDDAAKQEEVVVDAELLKLLGTDAPTYGAQLEALDGQYFRSVEVKGDAVHIYGKGRELARLEKLNRERLEELARTLREYDSACGFYYDNMSRVYNGIDVRMSSAVPEDIAESVISEAVARTALNQLICNSDESGWKLHVEFSVWNDGDEKMVAEYELPRDEIDFGEVYEAAKIQADSSTGRIQ